MKISFPWEHYIVDDFLPAELINGLKQISISSNNLLCDGTRTPVINRYFFTPDCKDVFSKQVVDFFKNNTQYFSKTFGYNLDDSYLRIELAQDDNNFWQVPHVDTLEKRITIIVYIDADDNTINLGTDLFIDPYSDSTRVQWKENRCLIFKTDKTKWHGFTKRQFVGNRRVLLVNYVDKDLWNSLNQVWSIDD